MADLRVALPDLRCTGCDKAHEEVRILIAFPAHCFVCGECVRLCAEVTAGREGVLTGEQIDTALDWLFQPGPRLMTAADLGLED
jgi:hypothetical protein